MSAHTRSTPAFTLRLDPTLPLCWENNSTLRFGFDRAEIRLHTPSPQAQRFIGMLRKGIASADLSQASRRAGITASQRSELLAALAPILIRSQSSTAGTGHPNRTVAVLGIGPLASCLEQAAARGGFSVVRADRSPDFVVLIERFLEPAEHAHRLLIERIPHLVLRMSDRSARIGPIVAPGGAPCLSCVELHGLQADPLAPVLAAQLFLDAPRIGTESCYEALAALTVAAIDNWHQGDEELLGTRLRFDLHHGRLAQLPAVEQVLPHPDCGCVGLSEGAIAA